MRIVVDLQACQAANASQGIGRSSLEFTRALARLVQGRHELVVALNAAFPVEAERIRAELKGLIPEERFVAWQTPIPCDGRSAGVREATARVLRQQFFSSLHADIVHTPSIFEGFGDDATTAIASANERQYIESATLHDLIPLVHRQIYLNDPAMDAWYRRKLDDLKRADLLLSVSAFSREEGLKLLDRDPSSIINISSGVDATFQPCTAPGDVKLRHGIHGGMVMYGGGIDVRKNIERLIQAYARLPKQLRVNRQLAIVCRISDEHRVLFAEIAMHAGLRPDELVMTGYVSDQDLIALYSSCDLFVFPSWHEGFGLPALEAMACGAPVIASAVSSLPEVVGRSDALFDPLDVDSILAVMARALSDRLWAAELGEHGLKRAAGFTWEKSASAALEAFEQAVADRDAGAPPQGGRPRLAYVSPMPPERSGISDYSAELLPALKRHYEVTVVTPEWKRAQALTDLEVRGAEWFSEHAPHFDRIVYQFGNSTFHTHMFELVAKYPGVVVLHDFFLSGIAAHLAQNNEGQASMWDEYLYRSHGYSALRFKAAQTDEATSIWKYPANFPIVERAMQVIVHSRYAIGLAEQWYGAEVANQWRIVPQLRAPIPQVSRAARGAARKRLSIPEHAWLVCSFGIIGPSKLSERLFDAWEQSGFAADPKARLVFVGANEPSQYGQNLETRLRSGCENASITGFVDDSRYLDYLLSADVAVQLRTLSRGETSRAALDCMAAGVPLIVNRNGSMAEIPASCAVQIDDEFDVQALVDALRRLSNPQQRTDMSQQQREHVHGHLSPELVAERYHEAIESSYNNATERSLRGMARALPEEVRRDRALAWVTCEALAFNNPGAARRQLLVDVSELVNRDARSGIQRVVRGVLGVLLEDGPGGALSGYRVEPIYTPGDGRYYYARAFVEALLGVSTGCADEPINVHRGDIFLGLDLAPVDAVRAERALTDIRLAGAKVFFVIYDVLPMQRPDCFPPEADSIFRPWTKMVGRIADGVACISRQVCHDFAEAADALQLKRLTPLPLWHFPLGMSLPAVEQSGEPVRPEIAALLSSSRQMILMVGTLEPRKGHSQALDAMERLWAGGLQALLVVVGKQGWMVEALVTRLDGHVERGNRLNWLTDVSDGELDALYAKASAVLCASEAEGYGLPLIEAASRGVALIARDIPVFRDVAGDHAVFFSGIGADELASQIMQVLTTAGVAPANDCGRIHDTWRDSVDCLTRIVGGELTPHMEWLPGRRQVFWAHQESLSGKHLVKRHGRLVRSDGKALVAVLRATLEPGEYRLTTIDPLGTPRQQPLPALATLTGQQLHIIRSSVTAHGSASEFRLDASAEGLRLSFPESPAAAIGTIVLERLD